MIYLILYAYSLEPNYSISISNECSPNGLLHPKRMDKRPIRIAMWYSWESAIKIGLFAKHPGWREYIQERLSICIRFCTGTFDLQFIHMNFDWYNLLFLFPYHRIRINVAWTLKRLKPCCNYYLAHNGYSTMISHNFSNRPSTKSSTKINGVTSSSSLEQFHPISLTMMLMVHVSDLFLFIAQIF